MLHSFFHWPHWFCVILILSFVVSYSFSFPRCVNRCEDWVGRNSVGSVLFSVLTVCRPNQDIKWCKWCPNIQSLHETRACVSKSPSIFTACGFWGVVDGSMSTFVCVEQSKMQCDMSEMRRMLSRITKHSNHSSYLVPKSVMRKIESETWWS